MKRETVNNKENIIKKKENIQVSINGAKVPRYIDNIAYALDEIASTGIYRQKRALLKNNRTKVR